MLTSAKNNCPIYFVNVVWGDSFTAFFLDVNIPSLLSRDNIPYFSNRNETKFILYTSEASFATIRCHPVFVRLSELIDVETRIRVFGGKDKHRQLSDCHIEFQKEATAAGAAAIYLSPDSVWADGCLKTVDRIFESGKKVIFALGMRLVKEDVLPKLEAFRREDRSISIGARELFVLVRKHLHPITQEHFFEKDTGGMLMPQGLMWRVGSDGILTHAFHLHPLLFLTKKFRDFQGTVDSDLVGGDEIDLDDVYVITDSDELLVVELSSRNMVYSGILPKGDVMGVARWAADGREVTATHWRIVARPLRCHAGISNEGAWQAAETRARSVLKKIAIWSLMYTLNPLSSAGRLRRAFVDGYHGRPMALEGAGSAALRAMWLLAFSRAEPRWLSPLIDGSTWSAWYQLGHRDFAGVAPLRRLLFGLLWLLNLRQILPAWPRSLVLHFGWLRQRAQVAMLGALAGCSTAPALWIRTSSPLVCEGSPVALGERAGIQVDELPIDKGDSDPLTKLELSRYRCIVVDQRLLACHGNKLLRHLTPYAEEGGRIFVDCGALRRWGPVDQPAVTDPRWHVDDVPVDVGYWADAASRSFAGRIVALDEWLKLRHFPGLIRTFVLALAATVIPAFNLLVIAIDRWIVGGRGKAAGLVEIRFNALGESPIVS